MSSLNNIVTQLLATCVYSKGQIAAPWNPGTRPLYVPQHPLANLSHHYINCHLGSTAHSANNVTAVQKQSELMTKLCSAQLISLALTSPRDKQIEQHATYDHRGVALV